MVIDNNGLNNKLLLSPSSFILKFRVALGDQVQRALLKIATLFDYSTKAPAVSHLKFYVAALPRVLEQKHLALGLVSVQCYTRRGFIV